MGNLIAVDFDGVLHAYMNGWQGPAVLEEPTPLAHTFLAKLRLWGFDPVITSTRAGTPEGLAAMLAWMEEYAMPEGIAITDKKVPALLTIDDRVWRFDGTWPTREQIEAACTPWNR